MSERRFEGKVALVTGGNSGIGLAVAQGLVDEGARVVIVGRNAETVARAAADLGSAAHGVVADTSRLADLDRVIAATREFGGGRLDVVFANAGVGTFGPLAATSEAMWDTTFDTNVKGVYFTVQKAVALMEQGRRDRPQRVGRRRPRATASARSTARARRRCARSAGRSPPSSSSAASASTSSAPGRSRRRSSTAR